MSPTTDTSLDEKSLRIAWLKRKFGSFEYHEELLRLHYEWMNFIKQAIQRPEVARDFPEPYRFFTKKAIPNFERVSKPGELDPVQWEPGARAGDARAIDYYDHDTGLDNKEHWKWITEEERYVIFPLWGKMNQMCTNIRQTVDSLWEDDILNERYTGPIDWPANWKQELLGERGASLE